MKVKKSKILNSKTIAAAFLTIGLCIVINLLLSLLDNSWEKLFSAAGSIGSVIIGVGMFYLGWQQHKHLEQKTSEAERELVRQNYKNLMDGVSKIYNNYSDISEITKAEEILRQVANQAKLELPKDLEDYTHKAYKLARSISLKVRKCFDHKRAQKPGADLVDYNSTFDEISQFFSANELYSKYLKIKKDLN